MGISILAKASLLVSSMFALGCAAGLRDMDGFPVYEDAVPKTGLSYSLSAPVDQGTKRLLDLGMSMWNDALGFEALRWASGAPDVVVDFIGVEGVDDEPAHTEIDGCLDGLRGALYDCTIKLSVPKLIMAMVDLRKVAGLFRQGPMDAKLFGVNNYSDIGPYLRDKLIVLSFVHEIGHTLGLGHARDPSCIMAATPRGGLGFCEAEIEAAKALLSGGVDLGGEAK